MKIVNVEVGRIVYVRQGGDEKYTQTATVIQIIKPTQQLVVQYDLMLPDGRAVRNNKGCVEVFECDADANYWGISYPRKQVRPEHFIEQEWESSPS